MSKELIKGIISAVSGIKEHNGKIQIGWTLKENPKKWYNLTGTEEELKIVLEEKIKKGNEVEFNYDTLGTAVSELEKLKEGDSWEDDIVNFETLLIAAHEKKEDFSIRTKCLKVDLEKKYALFKASVIIRKATVGEVDIPSRIFEGHGDATAENVSGEFIKPHFIRMAETRAICRALRWYTNNACAEEEKSAEAPKPEAKKPEVKKEK